MFRDRSLLHHGDKCQVQRGGEEFTGHYPMYSYGNVACKLLTRTIHAMSTETIVKGYQLENSTAALSRLLQRYILHK